MLRNRRFINSFLFSVFCIYIFFILRLYHSSSEQLPLYVHDIFFPNLRRAARKPFDEGPLRQPSPSVASCCSRF